VGIRLYLLRHGEVTSHHGDVPITRDGERQAYEMGQAFRMREAGPVRILSGETRRAVDTASHLARGLVDAGGRVVGPEVAFALRNPDLYLAGVRVNMVSSTDAFASQVGGVAAADVADLGFFTEFIESPDRIGWWLTDATPPGEDAAAIATRVRSFAVSLADPVPARSEAVIAVTHSPLIRAAGLDLLGRDIGEPPWVSGLLISVGDEGGLVAEVYEESR
jgi:broad specificity phosphatase PhoE